jgi:hypothetical protein
MEALGLTQPLTEMSTRSRKIMFVGSRARAVRGADNLAAICEPIVYTMWNPQHLTTLQASMACYKDCFAHCPWRVDQDTGGCRRQMSAAQTELSRPGVPKLFQLAAHLQG